MKNESLKNSRKIIFFLLEINLYFDEKLTNFDERNSLMNFSYIH